MDRMSEARLRRLTQIEFLPERKERGALAIRQQTEDAFDRSQFTCSQLRVSLAGRSGSSGRNSWDRNVI
jgi:hypothetical protein